jgi:hypothetical protein
VLPPSLPPPSPLNTTPSYFLSLALLLYIPLPSRCENIFQSKGGGQQHHLAAVVGELVGCKEAVRSAARVLASQVLHPPAARSLLHGVRCSLAARQRSCHLSHEQSKLVCEPAEPHDDAVVRELNGVVERRHDAVVAGLLERVQHGLAVQARHVST